MNSLEEQVRAAVQTAASEIGPDDVPPMRPIGAGSRHRAARPRRRDAWRWGAPLAAAAAVVAVVAAAGLLSGGVPSHASHPAAARSATPAAHPRAVAPGYPPNLEAGLIGFFLPASGAQFTTGALFSGEYRWLEGKISAVCIAGYGYRVPAPATPAEIARAFWDLTQFPDLAAIARAGTLPSYSMGPTPPESKAYKQAAAHCDTVAAAPFTPMLTAGENFGSSFVTVVSQIQSSAPVTATLPELRTCAARYGWPSQPYGAPDATINSFGDFVDWVAGHIDGAGSRGASTSQLNALNRHWGTVLVQCARPAVAVMEKLQLSAQAKFMSEHQRQFAALVKVARADFARAGRLARG